MFPSTLLLNCRTYNACSFLPIKVFTHCHRATSQPLFNNTSRWRSLSSPPVRLFHQPLNNFYSSFQHSPTPSLKCRHLNRMQNSQISLPSPLKGKILSQLLLAVSPLMHPRISFRLLAKSLHITKKLPVNWCSTATLPRDLPQSQTSPEHPLC